MIRLGWHAWSRLPLAGRLVAVMLLGSSLGSVALLGFQLDKDSSQHEEVLSRQAREEIESLVPAVGDQALIGDYTAIQQILDRFSGHANVTMARWVDSRGKVVSASSPVQPSDVPASFRRWLALSEMVETRPITIGGREYGAATVRLGPAAMEVQLWATLVDNAAILFLAWIAQAGLTVLVLRRSVRSLTRLDGAVRRIEAGDLSQRLEPDGSPEIRHLISAFNGMSDALEAANRRSLHSLHDAEAAHRELTRFSEILTHHLQEPVRQIISFGRMLEQGGGHDLDCLPLICEGATRLRGLLADIELYLALSHLPAADARQSAERAVKAALTTLSPMIEACDAEISVGPLPMVWLDMRRLTLLFKELIGNAVEYRAPDRKLQVKVSAVVEGPMARFDVADNGIGIEARYLERIFGVFNRLHTRAEHPGNGIGLAMVRKIVLAAGGQVEVESEMGTGTVFSLTLPLNQPIGSHYDSDS